MNDTAVRPEAPSVSPGEKTLVALPDRDSWAGRLGFAAKVSARKLPTSDNRRPQNNPHLRHSLAFTAAVFDYLEETGIRMYRMPSNLIPYATHPQHPQFVWETQLDDCAGELAQLGVRARTLGLRLSFHPSQYILLNSPRPEVVASSRAELDWQCRLLDAMGLDAQARVFLHVGGVYEDRPAAAERMLREIDRLPAHVRARFALENDDRLWPARDVLDLCQRSDLPMIFDVHHHWALNHEEPWEEMLAAALTTWGDVRPKIHLSSPRDPTAVPGSMQYRAHHDFIDSQVAVPFAQRCDELGLPVFDIMLEAKRKDEAVLQLRDDFAAAGLV